MVGIRLITTGLKETIHSVIGYEIHSNTIGQPTVEQFLLKPKDGTEFDFDAMFEVNKLSIPFLKLQGLDRDTALLNLARALATGESIVVWYKPFITSFLASEDIDYDKDKLIDLLPIAQGKKGFTPIDFTFSSVCEALNAEPNLVQVAEKLHTMESIKAVRRL